MSRVNLDISKTSNQSRELMTQIHKAFGASPNMFKAVANSPAALKSMWSAFGALSGGVIPAVLGDKIAVAIANRNRCEYCLAVHTVLGRRAGATAEEMAEAQAGRSQDPQTAAAITFALKVVNDRAQIGEADIATLRAAGFDDEHIVEILAHVALNLFTNYVNVAFDIPADFPRVALSPAG